MHSPTLSLTDPPAGSPVAESVAWVQGAALGTIATTVAVIAVATIGLLMLSGRLELRRGVTVAFGCFILFGAGGIATALTDFADTDTQAQVAPASDQSPSSLQPTSRPPAAYDPYAGASVPDRR